MAIHILIKAYVSDIYKGPYAKNLDNKAVKHKNKRDNHNLMWKSENLLFT